MKIKVSKFIKKKINKSELKEIFKISNIIEEYLNQKEVNQRIQNSNVKGTDSLGYSENNRGNSYSFGF